MYTKGVIKSGKLRCGYVAYSPGCLKDPNTGELSGIGIDSIKMVAKNLGLQVEWAEEVGWGHDDRRFGNQSL